MAFNNFYRTLFAICLTVLIFAVIVGALYFIHRRESQKNRLGETPAHVLPPPPVPHGIHLPDLSTDDAFRDSGETPVAPVVSATCCSCKKTDC
jgi:hypothetical protein